jgi:TDG/mug DNA glycosylase family protein
MILPDLLDYNLNIVFCGMAASKKSKQVKAYYAGPGNKFWKTLHTIGLTTKQLKPEEFSKIIEYKIGLTDICKTDFGNDNELDSSKYDVKRFSLAVIKYQPRIVCFNGKNAAKIYLNKKKVDYGIQNEKIGQTKLFIAPSTSGAASGFWDLNQWEILTNCLIGRKE